MTSVKDEPVNLAVEVGANIHQVMWRKKITQAQLGATIGVGQTTAGKKIRGEVAITVVELMQIARLLEVEPGDLLVLPRLDSNQQPSGYLFTQVKPRTAAVVDLSVRRAERARRAAS